MHLAEQQTFLQSTGTSMECVVLVYHVLKLLRRLL